MPNPLVSLGCAIVAGAVAFLAYELGRAHSRRDEKVREHCRDVALGKTPLPPMQFPGDVPVWHFDATANERMWQRIQDRIAIDALVGSATAEDRT